MPCGNGASMKRENDNAEIDQGRNGDGHDHGEG